MGVIHFYWAFGGRWGVDATFPTLDAGPENFKPPFIATIIVGLGLCTMGLFYFLKMQSVQYALFTSVAPYVQWIIPAIFTIRAVGDFKYVGFFKSRKNSLFAEMDTKFFSPLCMLIALLGFVSVYF